MKRDKKKLSVHKQSVRRLSEGDMGRVKGGLMASDGGGGDGGGTLTGSCAGDTSGCALSDGITTNNAGGSGATMPIADTSCCTLA